MDVLLVACALTITGLILRREFFPAATPTPAGGSRTIADWQNYVVGQRIGPADAKVTIVEFSDFQCPYCREAAGRLTALVDKHRGQVALVYRHFPLSYHEYAVPAAVASICAGKQGRFEKFHDLLFARQDSLGQIPWTEFATAAGVSDEPAFEACLASAEPAGDVERDRQAGSRLGVRGTPAFLINDQLISGTLPGLLEEAVERAVQEAIR